MKSMIENQVEKIFATLANYCDKLNGTSLS